MSEDHQQHDEDADRDPAAERLREYRAKRDFAKTREPSGDPDPVGAGALGGFCVQKHDASRLHYDVRLELDGVLKSWAVPKGPSLDPNQKPLAVQTEDHPLEYATFEGVIPEGEYGGGTVMVWDQGTWEPIGDPHEGLVNGDLKFTLHGEKLRGEFVLARIKPKPGETDRNWLLIKKRDEHARAIGEYNVLGEAPRSVLTGRTLSEIAADADAVWTKGGEQHTAPSRSSNSQQIQSSMAGAVSAALPSRIKPQLATPSRDVPPGDDWLHEIKLDGYRLLCRIAGDDVRFYTRNGNDWTDRFPSLVSAARALRIREAWLDGEVVVLDDRGISDFQRLQNAFRDRSGSACGAMMYLVFDIPFADGWDFTRAALLDRKAYLQRAMQSAAGMPGHIQYCDHIIGKGQTFFEHARASGLEGIISKRANATYQQMRSRSWLKIKCTLRQDFVIGGYTDPSGSRKGFGGLLLGCYDDGQLVYHGRVGTGFTEGELERLARELEGRETRQSPFVNPEKDPDAPSVHWVRPELVAEIEFGSWTNDDIIRHPVYHGIREDMNPHDVHRERPDAASESSHERRSNGDCIAPMDSTSPTVVRVVRTPGSPAHTTVAGVSISNPMRTVYPDDGITKVDVARYYETIGQQMLQHVVHRPLSLVRCPLGLAGDRFYQRELGEGWPKAIHGLSIGNDHAVMVKDVEGLVSLVQMGTLEIHGWQCRDDNFDRPDQIVFDLDPGEGVEWEHIVASAVVIGDHLRDLGLETFPKTTGGKGVHLVAPIVRRHNWHEVKAFALAVAKQLAQMAPRNFTATMTKELRTHRIYIDYLRNQEGATSVAPYSTRARNGATVSMPVSWVEFEKITDPQSLNVRSVVDRLRTVDDDPWDGFFDLRQSITKKMKRAVGLS